MNENLKHRYYSGPVHIIDKNGKPVANQKLQLKQTKHKFLFGCNCFFLQPWLNPETISPDIRRQFDGKELDALFRKRIELWLELFNMATIQFYWGQFEPVQGQPRTKQLQKTAQYLLDRGITIKGHPLCWHTVCAPWLLKMTNQQIFDLQVERIHREVRDFKGMINMWDVINEVVIMPNFDKYDNGVTRICKDKGRIETVKAMFQAAREENPEATLLINDFDLSPSYVHLIEDLLDAGVPIDCIGIQSHQHQGYWGKEKLEKILNRYEKFKLPLQFTENTIISGAPIPPYIKDLNDWQVKEWPSTPEYEELQKQQMREFYTTLFEHPLVQGIINWDFADGAWLNAPSGIIRRDNTVKPAYEELHKMIKKEWWTDTTIYTDDNGIAQVTAMHGDYNVIGKDFIQPLNL